MIDKRISRSASGLSCNSTFRGLWKTVMKSMSRLFGVSIAALPLAAFAANTDIQISFTGTLTEKSCSAGVTPVTFPTVGSNKLEKKGDFSDPVSVAVKINCTGTVDGITLTYAGDKDEYGDYYKIDGTSSAKGVAIELKRDSGTGDLNAGPGKALVWTDRLTSGGGESTLAHTARVVRTGDTMSFGSFSATASFTMTYP